MIQLVRVSYIYQFLPPVCLSSLAFGQRRRQRQEPGHQGSLSPASGRWAGSLLGPGLGRQAPGRGWRRLMRWWLSLVQQKTSAAIREKKKKNTLNIYTCHAISIITFWLSSWAQWWWVSVTNGKEAFVVSVRREEHLCKRCTWARPRGQASPASLRWFSCSSFQHVAALGANSHLICTWAMPSLTSTPRSHRRKSEALGGTHPKCVQTSALGKKGICMRAPTHHQTTLNFTHR